MTTRRLGNRPFLLAMIMATTLGMTIAAWAQGGSQTGRGAPPQGAAAQQAGAPGSAAGRSATSNLYNYDAAAASGMAIPDVKPTETHQKIIVSGETLAYTARAGYIPLRNATTGQPEAYLFFTSYTKDGVGDASARPLIFFLAGAPGVAAAWQEFGGVGPKRMKWAADGTAGSPPYAWLDNSNTLLGVADLVFVNPVGTAFSRPVQPNRGPTYWNTAGDTASLAEFVRSYLNLYDRRNSPLFVAGEDSGTGRAAGLAVYLHEHQIPITGVILLSMTLSSEAVAGDGQYLTLLPSLALAAWSHKKLAPELQALAVGDIVEQARQFASRDYLHALYKGDRMTPEERAKAVADLSRLTGLSKPFIVNNNLRITLDRFNAELLRDRHRALSNSDARVTGFVPGTTGGRGGFGGFGGMAAAPAMDYNQSYLAGGFLAAYEAYLRRELGFNSGGSIFYLVSGGIGTFTSTGSDDISLPTAFVRNPRLRLFAAVNYFDLNAPFSAAEFTLTHLNVSPEVRARNITVSHYESGQMTYLDDKALAKLQADLSKFVNDAVAPLRQ